MNSKIPPVTRKTYKQLVRPWLEGIVRKDVTAVVSYPISDRQRRFLNLMDDKKTLKQFLEKPEKFVWVVADFRVDMIDSPRKLERVILQKLAEQGVELVGSGGFEDKIERLKKEKGLTVVLAGFGGERLVDLGLSSIISWFAMMSRSDVLRMLLFFETNLWSEKAMKLLGSTPTFQPKIVTMKLYDEQDTRQFVEHMCLADWQIKLSGRVKQEVVSQCEGIFFLVKEVLRCLRDKPKAKLEEVLSSQQIEFDLSSLWQTFNKSEQETLWQVVKGGRIEQATLKRSLKYLLDVGYVKERRGKLIVTGLLFERYIKKIMRDERKLVVKNRRIEVDGVPVNKYFSKKQRDLLRLFVSRPNQVVEREAIAKVLWPEETMEKYSDWAIDSQISRLRGKLRILDLDPGILETKKAVGVVFYETG